MKFKINKQVFEKFPNLVIALPVIIDFDNTKGKVEALAYLREQEKKLRESMNVESFWTDVRVTSYQDVFRKFGVDPNKFKPAHVALASRVLEGKDLPDINPMANLYNALSIEHLTPYGGEDLETLYGDFELDYAKGGEQWIPIGGGKPKPAIKGELIWGDDYDLSTRALN
jgi:DNA/RNA-binding domain of Phe-tRNA-synthetase-like protein